MLELEIEAGLRDLELSVALDVAADAPLALVGPSGAGKSTVLRTIAGLRSPRSGRISCGGTTWLDTDSGTELAPERRRCGYVFQGYALFGHLSSWRNVAFGLGALPRAQRRDAAVELLDRFGVGDLAEARPATLSGGERQRVALARALGSRPRALLLDEPLAALDASTRAGSVRELAGLIAEAGVPTVLVTHDFIEATTLAAEVAVLEGGRIVQRDSPERLAARPVSSFVAEVSGSCLLAGTSRAASEGPTEVEVDGGGIVTSTDASPAGPVSVSVHPWDIALEPAGVEAHGSPRNRLPATVRSLARIGSRVRIGIDAGQPLVVEITEDARAAMALKPGSRVTAVWKASATRLIAR